MTPRQTSHSTPVYSTEQGRLCPGCGQAREDCACSRTTRTKPGDGIVRIARQTKGRKGKGVCLVTGLPLAPEALEALARALKQRCGCGGTVKDGVIEIQGDHVELLLAELIKHGFKAKKSGG